MRTASCMCRSSTNRARKRKAAMRPLAEAHFTLSNRAPAAAKSSRTRCSTVEEVKDPKQIKWSHYIPPTARVRASMKADFNEAGQLVAASDPVPSAGAFEAVAGNLRGTFRGRVLPGLPIKQDFEAFQLSE